MKKYTFRGPVAISIIFCTITCLGMQKSMLQNEIHRLLLPPIPLKIIKQGLIPQQSRIYALLKLGIKGDDLTTVRFLLPLIDACYAAQFLPANCIAESQERIRTFNQLNNVISQRQYQDHRLNEFRKRYGKAINILGLLKANRDEQLCLAIDTGNLKRVQALLNLKAYLNRHNMHAFEHARRCLRQFSCEQNPNQKALETARQIMQALCNRRTVVFFTAISKGQQSLVREMLNIGATPMDRDYRDVTAIARANLERRINRNHANYRAICSILADYCNQMMAFAPPAQSVQHSIYKLSNPQQNSNTIPIQLPKIFSPVILINSTE